MARRATLPCDGRHLRAGHWGPLELRLTRETPDCDGQAGEHRAGFTGQQRFSISPVTRAGRALWMRATSAGRRKNSLICWKRAGCPFCWWADLAMLAHVRGRNTEDVDLHHFRAGSTEARTRGHAGLRCGAAICHGTLQTAPHRLPGCRRAVSSNSWSSGTGENKAVRFLGRWATVGLCHAGGLDAAQALCPAERDPAGRLEAGQYLRGRHSRSLDGTARP